MTVDYERDLMKMYNDGDEIVKKSIKDHLELCEVAEVQVVIRFYTVNVLGSFGSDIDCVRDSMFPQEEDNKLTCQSCDDVEDKDEDVFEHVYNHQQKKMKVEEMEKVSVFCVDCQENHILSDCKSDGFFETGKSYYCPAQEDPKELARAMNDEVVYWNGRSFETCYKIQQ